jgi:hypothetical protein
MTMTRRATLLSAASLAVALNKDHNAAIAFGFAPSSLSTNSLQSFAYSSTTKTSARRLVVVSESSIATTDSTTNPFLGLITPEGYGFSSPVGRILSSKLGGSGLGFFRAKASMSVIDVMAGINSSDGENNKSSYSDVALIFDDVDPDLLLGIFTDADYIRLAVERSAATQSEVESAAFIAAPVSNFMTPASKLICVGVSNTASQALAVMSGMRYQTLSTFRTVVAARHGV